MRIYTKIKKPCSVCGVPAKVSLKSNEPLCWRHYLQKRRHGYFFSKTIYDPNDIEKHKYYALVVIRNKLGEVVAKCKIDNEDIERVSHFKWGIAKGYTVCNREGEKRLAMHQLLVGIVNGKEIDHINRDRLDNRKINLRHVSHMENTANREATGVTWDKDRKQWAAQITREGRLYHLGRFNTRIAARKARLQFERNYSQTKTGT